MTAAGFIGLGDHGAPIWTGCGRAAWWSTTAPATRGHRRARGGIPGRPGQRRRARRSGADADADHVRRRRPRGVPAVPDGFETFSRTFMHLGPVGTGQLTKLLNNAMTMSNLTNAADMLSRMLLPDPDEGVRKFAARGLANLNSE
jgi:hypothetical protein